jgi:hypothetical protein
MSANPSKAPPAPPPAQPALPPATKWAWSFRYEGPPAGLAVAIAAGTPRDTNAQAQYEEATETLLAEASLRPESTLVCVTARGDAGQADNGPRNLALAFRTIR